VAGLTHTTRPLAQPAQRTSLPNTGCQARPHASSVCERAGVGVADSRRRELLPPRPFRAGSAGADLTIEDIEDASAEDLLASESERRQLAASVDQLESILHA